jgi:K+ potassium transporter
VSDGKPVADVTRPLLQAVSRTAAYSFRGFGGDRDYHRKPVEITGAFSMTRQAIQLGGLARLQITEASEKGYGQIYVGAINWLLIIVTVGLTLFFGMSDNLVAARQ